MQLGTFGIWASPFRTEPRAAAYEAIAELEELGYSTLWFPGGGTDETLDVAADLLRASTRIVVASGILNIWMHDPTEVAATFREIDTAHPGRFLLGLGVSHAHLVEPTDRRYERPRSVMIDFLDALDAAPSPVLSSERVLAALGPRMLELARERSAGAHPYCVPVEHTVVAREVLGEGPLLAPELKAVLMEDREAARAVARAHLARYLGAPNYANNLVRLGYDREELAGGGSDRVVDALVVCGDEAAIATRAAEHLAAGADHVCVQILTEDPARFPIEEWRTLAPALLS